MNVFDIRSNKESISTFLLAAGYGIFIVCFLFFLYKCGMIQNIPGADALRRWDSGIYEDIKLHGYTYKDPHYNNSGFFIFYPWVWRLLHVGVVGICCVNYLFFITGFTIISGLYKLTTTEKLLWLSIPTVYMMMIPYSEAVFFLLIAITFYGIIKNKRWIIWAGLFLASLTRATGIFLLPAFLIMELLCEDSGRKWYETARHYCVTYVLPIIAGLAFFVWYQYHAIGVWFAYFIQQQKYEGHIFGMPVLPFSSFEGPRILWISALAVFCCFLSIIVVVIKIFKRFYKKTIEPDKLLVVSLVYLGVTLYKTIFYNPTWGAGLTLLVGISRYVFAAPFFYVFLHYFTNRKEPYKPLHFVSIFLLCNIVWLTCGSYVHILAFLYFNFATLMVMFYMLLPDKRLAWPPMAIIAMNVLLQVITFQQFLGGAYLD